MFEKKFLSVAEIAAITGLSPQFFYIESYKANALGEGLPVHKFGSHCIRFVESEVLDWLKTRKDNFKPLSAAIDQRRAAGTYQPRKKATAS